jgi:hypothetical protein
MRCVKFLTKGVILLSLALALGCEKVDDGNYVRPLTIYEKIMGKWSLTSVKQVDEIALAGGVKPNELDLTTKFTFKTFKITLNVDSTNEVKPTTYLVEGTAPALFNAQGYWDLDKPYSHTDGTVSKLYLYSDEAKTTLTNEIDVVTVPGTKAVLGLKLIRSDNGTPFLSYTYSLKPSI